MSSSRNFMSKFGFESDVGRGWIISSIIMAAFPILIKLIWARSDIYEAVLSYSYAVLIVSAYLYYMHTKIYGNQKDTLFFGSVTVAIIFIILLIANSTDTPINKFVNIHGLITATVSIITIILTFCLAYKLNVPIISLQESELKKVKKKFEDADKVERRVRNSRKLVEKAAEEEGNERS